MGKKISEEEKIIDTKIKAESCLKDSRSKALVNAAVGPQWIRRILQGVGKGLGKERL